MVSTEDSNRVGGAELSAEEAQQKLVEIADAIIGRPMSFADMVRLAGDDEVPEEPWAHDVAEVAVEVHGFSFEEGGYSFTVHRVDVDVDAPEEMTV